VSFYWNVTRAVLLGLQELCWLPLFAVSLYILNGTTIEEVRDYHRETFLLCVEEANKGERRILDEKKKQQERERSQRNQHYANIRKTAEEMKF